MRTGKIIFRLCFVLLPVLAGIILPCTAQNNPYKIHDALYSIYLRADRLSNTSEGLSVADSLRLEALRIGDKKAECLAYTIPLKYYAKQSDCTKLEMAVEKLKKVSRANDYLQYYYYAYNQLITYYLNYKRSLRALQTAEEMKLEAVKDQHPYGIYTCIRTMSRIYYSREQFQLANEYNMQALDYMLKELPDQDPTQLYVNVAQYYTRQEDKYELALEYIKKAEKSAVTERGVILALIQKCIILYKMKRYDEFSQLYGQLMKSVELHRSFEKDPAMIELKILKCIMEHEYNRAHKYAEQLIGTLAIQSHAYIYEASGMYQQCITALCEWQNAKDSIVAQLQQSDIAELSAQIGNEHLKMENMRLELERQHYTSRYRTIFFFTIIIFLALSVCYLIFYLYRRREVANELRCKNEELRIARDQAEVGNRMKTAFIQNMSHEIRTPLNSIVGFSQVITDPDMKISPEEAQDYSRLIQRNSEQLTTLVNNLLSLSDLESNEYAIHTNIYSCNEICRESISAVTYRKPENVRLYYTSEVSDDYLIYTDSQLVRRVLINLLTNSEKHTTEGEIHLHCSLTEFPSNITFSVIDTGCGIPADRIASIFKRFEKLDPFEQGTGLGLNICRIIAERLNGEVRLDTDCTQGTRFLFILPLQEYHGTQTPMG